MGVPLLDLRTVKGRRIQLHQFGTAPLATLSVANRKITPMAAIVVNQTEARALAAALTEFADLVDAEGGDPRLADGPST